MLGAIDTDLAEFFGVTEKTINTWKEKYPEFLQSLRDGKEAADANVADSLYQRACGYSHSDTDIRVIDSKIVTTEITKHFPPDTGAAMAWLKNRQRRWWRDRQDHDLNIPEPIKVENADKMDIAKRLAYILSEAMQNQEEGGF